MRTPVSTYRLQITEDLDLRAAARLLPYLRDLGADWVYLSPLLASEADSDHGYDVADHSRVDPARGGLSGLAALSTEAHRLGMGVLVDIVPNHVGIARPQDNAWWWHVLTHGPESPYAEAFDIDWAAGGGRLRIPVVGDDDLPERGGPIRNLSLSAGELVYHDQRFPLAPGTAERGPGGEEPDVQAVHARQHYELVGWRDADAGLNYRRFFAINTLAAIRVEDPTWFARSHAAIKQWFDEGLVDGLRVDHPDGLRDPGGYLDDLAELTGGSYVVVEKILALHEHPPTGSAGGPWLEELPASWATAGTTGYDALALIDRLLTDAAGREPLEALETRLRGGAVDWEQLTHDRKRTVADTILRSEVLRIGRELRVELPDAPGATEDAVAELLACFPVYRSYLPLGREHLEHAAERARELRPDLAAALDAVVPALADPAKAPALRFQQTSGMVMAKGVEDCAFYRSSRLTSLNEVGGEPSVFSVTAGEFHALMARRQEAWPHAMTTLSTHDTKRGEDVRARITALAEVPAVWEEAVTRLQRLVPLPDPGFGSLLWQAVLGAWPASRERLHGYAEKAMREAGDRTTWTAPEEDYEAAVHAAVDAAFDDPAVVEILEDLAARVADAGWSNALAAKLLALTVPGVPDVYQGSELWEQSLVDPDNRRPVDFEARQKLLESLADGARPRLSGGLEDPGTAKLLVTRAALQARRDRPELFTGYAALPAEGPAADHVVGFDRGGAVTVATRLPLGLQARGGWGETTLKLPRGRWTDAVSGRSPRPDDAGRVLLGDLLAEHPVALLLPQTEPERPTEGRTSRRRGRFDVWAPFPETVSLSIGDQVVPMHRGDDDWWRPAGPVPEGEADYGYLVDGAGDPVPDPRSRRQPGGVHARSRSFDPAAHGWSDQAWTGRQLAGAVIYELHLGTFTPEGTLDAAIGKLDHLRSIGVDFVELLPVNAFNGTDNWGYDGVLWHAVHEGYGGPAAYQRFVDAAHRAGLGVIQDVVYNHLGPSGNYLPLFGPYLKTEGSNTWGALVNLDGNGSAEVRRYILDNAVMWLDDYHVDGLRLDAVHALEDSSATHLLEELAIEVTALSAYRKRPMTLIAESDLNDASMVTPREGGGLGIDGQWSDDFHHAVHVALTGETDGYYADFEPLSALAKVCTRGFFHDGTWSSFRGRPHGAPVDLARMPAWRLVVCTQNHDQVGNRARGDRLTETLDEDQLGCAALLTLAGPFTPMLFQGEEWAASTPFCFFTTHPEPELGEAVRRGRLQEFEQMGWDPAAVPDPQDPDTLARSRLDWGELERGRHARVLALYRRLAELRRTRPELTDPRFGSVSCSVDEARRLFVMRRSGVLLALNLGEQEAEVDLGGLGFADALPAAPEVLVATASGARLEDGRVVLPRHAGALLGAP